MAQHMMAMRAFPERAGCRIRVSFESRKFTCVLDDPSAAMTRESVRRL